MRSKLCKGKKIHPHALVLYDTKLFFLSVFHTGIIYPPVSHFPRSYGGEIIPK